MINWKGAAQPALARAGYYAGAIDGVDGPKTWTALFAFAAGRQADVAIQAIGRAAGAWLREDAIALAPACLAEFIAQTAHETGNYTRFEENLRYSSDAMLRLWPSHFTPAQAAAAVGKPIEIASRAYGGRMGNAPYPSTDGWHYRGRGMLQLTGRDNYARYGKITGLPLIEQPNLAADPADSLVIAREFWRNAKVNECCDAGDFYGARGLTNVGSRKPKTAPIGLDDVAARRARLLSVLA